MFSTSRTTRLASTLALALLASTVAAAPAAAQSWPGAQRNRGYQTHAYEYGYRDGLARGERDGRDNRAYALDQHREYQRADRGYERRDGDLRSYQQEYRNAFATGYREGYERYGRGTAGQRGGVNRYPGYPSSGGSNRYPDYPSTRQDGRSGYGYSSPGYDAGYSDGYEKGVDDADDRDRFDPLRHGRYKSADRGYDRRYGSKDAYKNIYREGFRVGYERGYRDQQRYGTRNSRNSRNSRAPVWWPF